MYVSPWVLCGAGLLVTAIIVLLVRELNKEQSGHRDALRQLLLEQAEHNLTKRDLSRANMKLASEKVDNKVNQLARAIDNWKPAVVPPNPDPLGED